MIRAIASQGQEAYLLTRETRIAEAERPVGRVLDVRSSTLHPPANIHSILGRGYWEEIDLSPDEVAALVAGVKTVRGPAVEDDWLLHGQVPAEAAA